MRFGLLALTTLGSILLVLLAMSSSNTSDISTWYWEIFLLNSLILFGLIAVIVRQAWQLHQEIKARVFGSRLTLRLVSMFALVAVLPGVLLFAISVLFLNRSIESWFNVRVETALESGLSLGRSAFETLLNDVQDKALHVQQKLENNSANIANMVQTLGKMREQLGIEAISLFDKQGNLIAFIGEPNTPNLTWPSDLHRTIPAKNDQNLPMYRAIETQNDTWILRVIFAIQPLGWRDHYFLQLQQTAPNQMTLDAKQVEDAHSAYQQLALTREGLKKFYRLTLSLSLLLSLAAAIILGWILSRRLSAPLSDLIAGTRAVAQGDFSHKNRVHRRDEFGMLGTMFNRMTRQLAEAQKNSDSARAEVEAQRLYLESILASMSSGLLAFDHEAKLRADNPSAAKILGLELQDLRDIPLHDWAEHVPHLQALARVLQRHAHDANQDGHPWQEEIRYQAPQGERLLLARGIALPDSSGFIMVFDDITELARAQRDAAWGEVAKRLAHEIRNPLTPIQLSAERLQMKLAAHLAPSEAAILERSTQTIVAQVAALKKMVDAFRDYARAPDIELKPINANVLLQEVLSLYETQNELKIQLSQEDLMIMGDSTLLRQVFHNLLKNAQEAVSNAKHPQIIIETARDSTPNEHNPSCIIRFIDNGTGFPADILPRAFEPYITNKQKGTGLGLAVVKKIIEEHQGSINITNRPKGGAEIVLSLPMMETLCEVATF